MKDILFIFCFVVFGFSAFAQKSHPKASDQKENRQISPNAPVASLEAVPEESLAFLEDAYDFGKIPQGKPVTHTFVFRNTGTKPLLLENVNASCGCTTPVWNRDTVAAGKTGTIVVGYNAAAEGVFDKSVTVIYNGNLVRQVHIKGEVWKSPVTSAPENTVVKSLNKEH